MNEGLRLANGLWITALDDDDEFDPDHIEVLLEHARQERAELGYGQLRVIDADSGRQLKERLCTWPPRAGHFNFLGSIAHAGFKRFTYDFNSHLVAEVADANLMRRMWKQGCDSPFSTEK